MTNEKKRMVPELRFRGFTDDWEQRKLSDVATFWDSQRIPVTASDRVPGETPYYGANGIQDHIEGYTHEGTYVLIAEDGANDLINYPVQIIEGRSWVNNHAHVVQGITAQLDTKFLAYRISSMDISRWLVGGGRAKLNGEVLQKMPITIPRSEEQTMIRRLLSNLDKTLVLHQRKHEALLKLKEAYLQKLFPEKDNKYPVLRFAGFTDDWEQRKLGDVAEFINGRAYKQKELLDSGKYPVLRVGNFNTNDRWYYSDLELPAKNYADKGDLLYTWATAFGPHIWPGPKVIYHYHIWKVELSDQLTKSFTMQLLQADQAQMTNSLNGSTMVHITKGTMESKVIALPSVAEQTKISKFLEDLDSTIALHQRKLEKLQELKKGYLQKMFC